MLVVSAVGRLMRAREKDGLFEEDLVLRVESTQMQVGDIFVKQVTCVIVKLKLMIVISAYSQLLSPYFSCHDFILSKRITEIFDDTLINQK